MRIEQIDIRNAAPRTYAALNAFLNETRAERLPDDPPVPLDEEIRRFQTIPAFIDLFAWIAAAAGAAVANAGPAAGGSGRLNGPQGSICSSGRQARPTRPSSHSRR